MQITYKDKVTLQSNPNIPDENKVTAKDMNEIKSVINFNEEEQQALNMSVQEIAQNVVNNSQEISNIKEEQTTQNDNIQTNSNNISDLQSNKADKNEIPTDLSQLSNENTKFVNETGLENAISQEKTQRQNADNNLQNQIDAITASTDVIDIVGTYQDLQDYDTSKVKQNDVIKVLKDSTHNNAMSYYRWQNQWIYIGIEGPYYTIGQTDELLQGKANQSDLKQTNTNVTNLAGRVSNNERKIENIEQEQTEQNTNISTNATNIESLQEENENLKKIVSQLPQVEGQGTEVTLENTIEAPFTIFDVEGNSEQESTKGYQLLKYPYVATTTTVNGVTFTDNGDGSLKINGTASEEAGFNLQWDNKVPAGSYSYIVFNLPNNCFANYYTIGNKYGEDVGNRTSDTEINLGSSIVVPAGVTVSNVTVYPMLISGTYTRETIPNWEKYTNGASPNPNYERPIYSAGDNIQLWGGFTFERSASGITFNQNADGTVTANGTATASVSSLTVAAAVESGICKTLAAGTYIVSGGLSSSLKVQVYDSNINLLATDTGSGSLFTLTEEKTVVVRLTVDTNVTVNNQTFYLKLEKGNKASGYSPYGMGSITEKIVNENIFDKDTATDGKRLGTDGNPFTDSAYVLSDYIIAKPSTNYMYSRYAAGGGSAAVCFYDKDKTFISRIIWNSSLQATTQTFTTPANTKYIRITDSLTLKNQMQVEEGTTSNPYTVHEEQDYSIFVQQPMRSIGDVRDVFFKNTVDSEYYDENLVENKWYERHCFGKVNQLSAVNGPVVQGFYIILGGIKKGAKLLSTHQQLGTSENSEEWKKYDGSQMKQLYPQIHNGVYINYKADTKQEQVDWWNSLNATLLYELAEPLDLPCTQAQIDVLENLPSTYKDFTIINSEDETPAYLEVSGIYDMNKLITRVEVIESEV